VQYKFKDNKALARIVTALQGKSDSSAISASNKRFKMLFKSS
jgi:hypothetical protein